MKTTKRIWGSIAAVLTVCAVTLTSVFAATNDWNSFRGNAENNGITAAAPARTAEEAELKWSTSLRDDGETWIMKSDPIILGDSIYIVKGTQLRQYRMADGSLTASCTLDAGIGYTCRLVADQNNIYVPMDNAQVEAVSIASMKKVWISTALELEAAEYSMSTPTLYNGKIYLQTSDWGSNGTVRCLNTSDGSEVWSYAGGSFYWGGAVVKNGALIVAGDNGKLLSLNADTGAEIAVLEGFVKVRSSMVLVDDSVYFTSADGKLNTVVIHADGTFGAAKSLSFAAASTSTPAIYNGKAYVGGNTSDYKGILAVINLADMTIEQSVSAPKAVQASPLIATGHNGAVFAYFTSNGNPGALYTMELGSDESEARVIYTPAAEKQSFCNASVIADRDGTLYYVNDSDTLFAVQANLSSVSSNASSEVLSQPVSSRENTEVSSVQPSTQTSSFVSTVAGNDTPATGAAGTAAGAAVFFGGALCCVLLVLGKNKRDSE